MSKNTVIASIIEELIGLATTLTPQPKIETPNYDSLVELDLSEQAALEKIKTMKSLLQELKEHEAFTSCPSCLEKLEPIEEGLQWAEQRVPNYQKALRLKKQLGELYELIKPRSDEEPKLELESKPESGKTFEGQTDESYCVECIEGHTMTALTEMRHAIDRFRSAGRMTSGVTEKIRTAIAELQGIVHDVKSVKDASPQVKSKLNEILDEVRWIRKEYGVGGKGLTKGQGSLEDLEKLKKRIERLQQKAYLLAEKL